MRSEFSKWFEQYELNNEYAAEQIALDGYQLGLKQRQTEVDELKKQLMRLGYTDKDGVLMKPPIGEAPKFDLLEDLQTKLTQAYEDVETFAAAHQRECEFKAQFAKEKDELQKRVDAALQEIKGAARWVDEDAIEDPEFIKGGVLRAFARLEQALKGEIHEN